MISSYYLESPVYFEENTVNVIVVENSVHFRSFSERIINGINGFDTDFRLSDEKFQSMELSKYAEFIIDPFAVDCSSKKILSKLAEEMTSISEQYTNELHDIMFRLNKIGGLMSVQSQFEATFSEVNDISKIIKLLDFSIDFEEKDTLEKVIEYMKICRQYLGKKLFIFLNLKCFFSKEELAEFYKAVFYEKINILLLERMCYNDGIECEKVRIIDSDLCEIY